MQASDRQGRLGGGSISCQHHRAGEQKILEELWDHVLPNAVGVVRGSCHADSEHYASGHHIDNSNVLRNKHGLPFLLAR